MFRLTNLIIYSLFFVLAGCDSFPDSPEGLEGKPFSQRVEAMVPGLLEKYKIPGAAVAVMEEGEITLMKGFGFANTSEGIPVTENHVFNVASISKAVTAWGVMYLAQSGKIDLDSPVNTYLKRWKLPDGAGPAREVTIRRLLSHTGGISMPSTPGFRWPAEVPTLVEILSGSYNNSVYAQPGTRAFIQNPPGKAFHYSGGGFMILQLMIEDITGKDFSTFMDQVVLKPLGMSDAQFGWDTVISEKMATPYLSNGIEEDIFRTPGVSASSLHASAKDLSKWMLAGVLVNSELRNKVISDESLSQMYRAEAETFRGNSELPLIGLAYFLEIGEGNFAAGHSGDNAGWQARVLLSPQEGDGFLVLTNSDSGGKLVKTLSCLWAGTQQGILVAGDC